MPSPASMMALMYSPWCTTGRVIRVRVRVRVNARVRVGVRVSVSVRFS